MNSTDRRWRPQKAVSILITIVMVLVPIGAAVLAATVLANTLPEPTATLGIVLWWIAVLGISFFAAWLADNVMRRFAPMAGLWKMSLVFPDKAPSRFGIALRSTNVSELRRRINQTGRDVDHATSAETILALATALSAHDRKTRGHSERTRAYTDLIADELDLRDSDTDKLRWAALLHDIGKLEISEEILNKDGPLTPDEFAQIKQHPILGMGIAAPLLPWLGNWADTIADHHEKWDGSGYPRGLRGEEISLGGRVVAVADSYDVMTSGRSYQPAKSPEVARLEIVDMAGSQFDPLVARALMSVSIGKLTWLRPMGWFASIPFVGGLDRILRDAGTVGSAAALTLVLLVTGLLPGLGDEGPPSIDPAPEVVASPTTQPPSTSPPSATQPPSPPTTPPSNPVPTPPPTTVPPATETTTTTTTTTTPPDTAPGTTFPLELTTTTSSTTTSTTTTTPTITAAPPPTTLPLQPNPDNATVVAGHDAVTVRPLANDTGNDLVLASLEGNELGETTIGEDRSTFSYLAHDGATGLDDFDYRVCDGWERCATQAISVRVTAPPHPILNPNDLDVLAGEVAVVDVLADDNGRDLTIVELRSAAVPTAAAIETELGDARVLPDETIEYRAKKSVSGVDELVYTVCDDDEDCARSNLTISLEAQPQPITEGDTASLRSGGAIVVDVLANDNGEELVLAGIPQPPGHGQALVMGDQKRIRYQSAEGHMGEDVLVYETCDLQGDCATDRVTITVEAPPAPDAQPDEGQVEAGKVTVMPVLSNDDGAGLRVRSIDQDTARLGKATISDDARSIRYSAHMRAGTEEFSYRTCDRFDRCATASVTVTVTPRRVPTPQPDTADPIELGHSGVIDVLDNDTGDSLVIDAIVSQPNLGSVEITESETIRYTANPDNPGQDNFRYRVCDGDGDCATALVTVTVILPDVDTQPDFATVRAGEEIEIDVLSNDDGDGLDLRRLDQGGERLGHAEIVDNQVAYRAHPSVKGEETFRYRVCDRHDTCGWESVHITVDPQPAPITQPDSDRVHEGESSFIAVLANDNGDGLVVSKTRGATRGHPTITPDGGGLRYQAREDESGIDEFQYQACDLDGDCVWETITVTVVPNRPPSVVDDWGESPPGSVRTFDVVANDSDPDGDPLGVPRIVIPPTYVNASVDNNGQIRIDLSDKTNPPQNRTTDIIRYEVCDPDNLCAQGQLIVRLVRRWDSGSLTPTTTPDGWWGSDPIQGGLIFRTDDNITNSGDNEEIYRTERFGRITRGDYGYSLPVGPGRWRVRLHFAEIWWNNNGDRVFDVSIEGELRLDDLDIHSLVGHDTALTRVFNVTVTDETLDIQFAASIDNASIVGIEIIPMHETMFEVATRRGGRR